MAISKDHSPDEQNRLDSYEPHKQNPLIVLFSIIISLSMLSAGIYFSRNSAPEIKLAGIDSATTTASQIIVKPITATDHILGNPDAPVKIIEFSDPECPFCKKFYITMHQIIDHYGKTGQVAWVYREFPIPSLHKRATKEVEAMECANALGGNDKFWEYTDQIFNRTGSNDTLNPAQLPIIANDIGLNLNSFNACLSADKYAGLITSESLDAVSAGAPGTPFSILLGPNGEKISFAGAQSYDVLKSLIDEALKHIPPETTNLSNNLQSPR
jgi:protein-disulfide isomerase